MGFLTFEIGIQIPRETGAVPPHGGLGCDNKECRLPTGPAPANEQREGPVGQIRPRTWMTAFQRRKLLAVRPDSQAVDVLQQKSRMACSMTIQDLQVFWANLNRDIPGRRYLDKN